MIIDLEKPISQRKFAIAVGLSRERISELSRGGILGKGASTHEWLIAYAGHLRDIAAQWQSADGEIDRVREAALLDRRKREKIELEIAEKRGVLLHRIVMIEGLTLTMTGVKAGLLAVPIRFGLKCTRLTVQEIELLKEIIRDVCNELTGDRFHSNIGRELEARLRAAEAEADLEHGVEGVRNAKKNNQRRGRVPKKFRQDGGGDRAES